MINISCLPCNNCEHFNGVVQPNRNEVGEYAECMVAESQRSNEILKVKDGRVTCKFFEDSNHD